MKLIRGSSSIASIDDWRRLAPPKRPDLHWKDGRSAKELARAWCGSDGPCAPVALQQLLAPLLSPEHLAAAQGWPELQVRIDRLRGEPPNIDLALVCDGHHGRTVVCIEAKADEPFAKSVLSVLNAAVVKIGRDEPTGSIARLQALAERLLPRWDVGLPHLGDLRYQLLTATAAALRLAKDHHAKVAAVVVHEFAIPGSFDPTKLRRNAHDLDLFVRRITRGAHASLPVGELVAISPPTPEHDWGDVALYIGKVTSGDAASMKEG